MKTWKKTLNYHQNWVKIKKNNFSAKFEHLENCSTWRHKSCHPFTNKRRFLSSIENQFLPVESFCGERNFHRQWNEHKSWHLRYFCQLWLEICCWRNFSFFRVSRSAVDSSLGLLCVFMAVCEEVSRLVATTTETEWKKQATTTSSSYTSFFSRQSFHPRAHTSPYLPIGIKR